MSRIDVSYRNIARITAPVALSQLSYTAMGIIDTIMVGRLGVTALAGVGLGNMITWWALSLFWGMLAGVNTLVAQGVGGGDRRQVGRALWQGLYLGLGCAVVMLALWPLAPTIFALTGASQAVQTIAVDYMRVRLLGGLGLVALMVADNFYRGVGRTDIPMWLGFVKLGINCGLNYVFVFGAFGVPAFGPVGAAIGTVVANLTIGVLMVGLLLVRSEFRDTYELRALWRFERRTFDTLFALSWPIGVQTFMEMGGITVFTAIIGRLGEAQLAATNAVIQSWSVAFTIGFALSVGATTLVGQSVGAGEPRTGRIAVRRIMKIGFVVMSLLAVGYLGFPEQLMSVFVEPADLPALVTWARPLFVIVTLCLGLDLVMMILWGALRGEGDTRYCMLANVGSAWLLFVPATLIAAPRYGVIGAWSCLILHLGTVALALYVRYTGSGWEEREPATSGAVSVTM